jgi:DNA modification methylase
MELNKIHQGDALDLLKQLPDNSVDLVITSPPYADLKTYIDFKGILPENYVNWFLPYCKEIERVIKPTGSFILNISDKVEGGFRHPYVFDLISELHKQTGLKMYERLFWNKLKSLPNKSRFGDRVEFLFWFTKNRDFYIDLNSMRIPYAEKSVKRMKRPLKKRFARTEGDDNLDYKEWSPNPMGALPNTLINISSESKRIADNHIAVFPVDLVTYFIKGATKPGDLVLDPFIGSGTTALAAKQLGREYLGFELQQEYIDLANRRVGEYVENI